MVQHLEHGLPGEITSNNRTRLNVVELENVKEFAAAPLRL